MRLVGTGCVPAAILALPALAVGCGPKLMTSRDLLALPQPVADQTVAYGPAPQQVAELRLPEGPGPHPVVVVIHGGCWQAPWAFDHIRSFCTALTAGGLATWSLEYRRLGDPGGGWPGTFEDVARGADLLRDVARDHPLDLERVVALGHSAGGHLALWLAGRHRLPEGHALRGDRPLPLRGAVSLAGIPDLRAGARREICGDAIPQLLGGPPDEQEERVRLASPLELLPLGVPQRLVCGSADTIAPCGLSRDYAVAARRAGDPAEVNVVEGVGHFELVRPGSLAWATVLDAVEALLDAAPAAP
jgi:acetyl esterase/lipase